MGTKALILKSRNILFVGTIIAIILFALATKIYWDTESSDSRYSDRIENIRTLRADMVLSILEVKYKELFVSTQSLANEVVRDIREKYTGRYVDLADDITHLGKAGYIQSDLQKIFEYHLKSPESYFNGIPGSANDKFALKIGRVLADLLIFTDFSINCSADGGARLFEVEYEKQYNKKLAIRSFTMINNGDVPNYNSNVFDKYNMFEFEANTVWDSTIEYTDNDGVTVSKPAFTNYSRDEFRNAIIYMGSDYIKIFDKFEFLAPIYIFSDHDLLGVDRVKNGIRQDANILVIVGVFNFKDVLDVMPDIRERLAYYDELERVTGLEHRQDIKYMLSSVLLLMSLICGVFAFIIKFAFEHNNTVKG